MILKIATLSTQLAYTPWKNSLLSKVCCTIFLSGSLQRFKPRLKLNELVHLAAGVVGGGSLQGIMNRDISGLWLISFLKIQSVMTSYSEQGTE
jgi:hypothetical protein